MSLGATAVALFGAALASGQPEPSAHFTNVDVADHRRKIAVFDSVSGGEMTGTGVDALNSVMDIENLVAK